MINFLNKIGLGTAQWGLTYGISNQSGQTKRKAVKDILGYARIVGIEVIDTARAYGEAEQVLGANDLTGFKIFTKIPKLNAQHIDRAFLSTSIEESFVKSLNSLGVERVQGLLLHSCDDLFFEFGPTIAYSLQKLKSLGKVRQIGVSTYSSLQIKKVLDIFRPDIIQLPFNVFDQRLLHDGTLSTLKDLGIEIHARSIFLQGLLLMGIDNIPSYFDPWKDQLVAWNKLCADIGEQPQHIALDFVASNSLIDQVIIGVENLSQLVDLTSFASHNFNGNTFNMCSASNEELLNPSLWNL